MMVARANAGSSRSAPRGLGGGVCTAQPALLARVAVLEAARVRLARELGLQLVTVIATAVGAVPSVAVVTPPAAEPRSKPMRDRGGRFDAVPEAWTRIPIEPRFKWKDL